MKTLLYYIILPTQRKQYSTVQRVVFEARQIQVQILILFLISYKILRSLPKDPFPLL